MKALLLVFCRPLGYVILFVSSLTPFLLVMQGMATDGNLLFYKEHTKLLMTSETVMILFALLRNEGREVEIIRDKAIRNAIFSTVLFLSGGMLYRVTTGDITIVDTSSPLIFLIISVLCLEFDMKEAQIDKAFKR